MNDGDVYRKLLMLQRRQLVQSVKLIDLALAELGESAPAKIVDAPTTVASAAPVIPDKVPAPALRSVDVAPEPPAVPDSPLAAALESGVAPFSEARKAIMREGWEIGRPIDVIAKDLNRLPGPTLSVQRIAIQANKMGLKRPEGHRFVMPAPSRPAPAAAPKLSRMETLAVIGRATAAKSKDGFTVVDVETMQRWGAERGLGPTPTLEECNAKRFELRQSAFRLGHG